MRTIGTKRNREILRNISRRNAEVLAEVSSVSQDAKSDGAMIPFRRTMKVSMSACVKPGDVVRYADDHYAVAEFQDQIDSRIYRMVPLNRKVKHERDQIVKDLATGLTKDNVRKNLGQIEVFWRSLTLLRDGATDTKLKRYQVVSPVEIKEGDILDGLMVKVVEQEAGLYVAEVK